MPVPAHLLRFIELNSAGRIVLLCRLLGLSDHARIQTYTRAVQAAVQCLARDGTATVPQVSAWIDEQVALLRDAVLRLPPPPPRLPVRETEPPPPPPRERRRRFSQEAAVVGKSMEEKLEDERRPLRKILQEDCVRLGLIDSQRAAQLSAQLAGKLRRDAEEELVAELRNNLHQQVNLYIRKYKGGPWDSVQLREELRVDIASTNSVHSVVTLTRHLLRERKDWEERIKSGRLTNLLGGRFKVSDNKP